MTQPLEQAFQFLQKEQTTLQDWDASAVEDIGEAPKHHAQHGGSESKLHQLQRIVEQHLPEAHKIRSQWEEGVDQVPSWMGLGASDFHIVTIPSDGDEYYGKRGTTQYTALSPTEYHDRGKKAYRERGMSPSTAADRQMDVGHLATNSHMLAPIPHTLATMIHRGMPEEMAISRVRDSLNLMRDRMRRHTSQGSSSESEELMDRLETTHVPVGWMGNTGDRVGSMYMDVLGDSDEGFGPKHREHRGTSGRYGTFPVMGALGLGNLFTGSMLHRLGADAMTSSSKSRYSQAMTAATNSRLFRTLHSKFGKLKRKTGPYEKFKDTMHQGMTIGETDKMGIGEKGSETDVGRNLEEGSSRRQVNMRPGPKFALDRKTWEDLGWGDLRPEYGAQHHLPKYERRPSSKMRPDYSPDSVPLNIGQRGAKLMARHRGQTINEPLPYDSPQRTFHTVIDGKITPIPLIYGMRDEDNWDSSVLPEELRPGGTEENLGRNLLAQIPNVNNYKYQTQLSQFEPEGVLAPPPHLQGPSREWFDEGGNLKLSEPMEIAYRLLKSIMDLGDDDVTTQPDQPVEAPAEVPRKALGIMGHHDWHDLERFDDKIGEWIDIHGMPTHIVSDGSSGTGAMATQWADDNGIPVITHKPNFRGGNRFTAPAQSRQRIVNSSDHILAFPSINASGTMEGIGMARQAGKPVHLHYIEHPHDTPISEVGAAEERTSSGTPWLTPEDGGGRRQVDDDDDTPPPPRRRQTGPARGRRGRSDDNVETGEPMDIWYRMLKFDGEVGDMRGESVPEERHLSEDELIETLNAPDLPEEVREDVLREIQRRMNPHTFSEDFQNINTGEPMDLAYRLLKVMSNEEYEMFENDPDAYYSHMAHRNTSERSEREDDGCCREAKKRFHEISEDSSFLGGSRSPNEQYMDCAEFEQYLEEELHTMRDMADIPMVAQAIHDLEDILERWKECDKITQPESADPTFTAGEPMDIAWRMLK